LRGFEFKGGGGADFRPAIAEAATWRPDLLIYLTDLQDNTGDEPPFTVLWAVPEGKAAARWGKIVELIKRRQVPSHCRGKGDRSVPWRDSHA